ncbi:MAG TPA: DUF393 domain-containing protein [Mycobacteriales bacterium]
MRSTLVYDGDCGFCTTCVRFVERRLPTGTRMVAWQHADLDALGVTRAAAGKAVQWVAPDGTVSAGAGAVGRLLVDSGWPWRALGQLVLTPPLSWLAAVAYRLVANNRHRLPGGTAACALPPDRRPGAVG